MVEPTIIAVDWSGAKQTTRSSGIWIASIRDGRVVHSGAASQREQAVAFVQECAAPVVAGFDFSFGPPAWFASENRCATVDDFWTLAERDGESWLADPPPPPFWRSECRVPSEKRFRRCEEGIKERWQVQPKSFFCLAGAGMVGPGSVRGMPHVAALRTTGHAVWPFDDATERTVVEIYPTLLRKIAPHHDVGPFANDDERDAVVSARVMWEHRDELATLRAATDRTTLIEGDVWVPVASPSP